MGKGAERKRELIKNVAMEPWQHNVGSLAQALGTTETTISRDLKELADRGFLFAKDNSGKLYLSHSGSPEYEPVKEPVLRQMKIIRFIASDKNGKCHGDIVNELKSEEISDRTIERYIKELLLKNVVIREKGRYKINPEKVISHLYLEEKEKTILLEALSLAEGASPLPEEVNSVSALVERLVSNGAPGKHRIYVHGRGPTHDAAVNYFCHKLEDAARSRTKLSILYRKWGEPAGERTISPLGIVYYWVLDKWYVVATDDKQPQLVKTFAVDNILLCERTGEVFEPPGDFDLRNYYKYCWGIYHGDELTRVIVRFKNYYTVGLRVKEEVNHRETCVLTEDEDGLIMTDLVQGLNEFAVWLRSFGPAVEVIEPPELRQQVIEEWRKTLACYEGGIP